VRIRRARTVVLGSLILAALALLLIGIKLAGTDSPVPQVPDDEAKKRMALKSSGESASGVIDSPSYHASNEKVEGPALEARKEFLGRWNAYSNEERRYTQTAEQLIDKYFTPNDLGEVDVLLNSNRCAPGWITALEVVCRLEPDKTKAFHAATEFLYKKKDWARISAQYDGEISSEVYNAFAGISRMGYIKSDEAERFLAAHLKRDKARELVRSSGLPSNTRFFTVEEAAAEVQESAAYGFLFAESDKAIEFVRQAFAARPPISGQENFSEHFLNRGFQRVLGLHNFYKAHGKEEADRILLEHNRMNIGSDLAMPLPIEGYKPPLPAPTLVVIPGAVPPENPGKPGQ
jgi:hypothetical protein